MKFQEYDCVLPQFDKFPEQRKMELRQKKKEYAFAPAGDQEGLPCEVKKMPEGESFSNTYKWKIFYTQVQDLISLKIIEFTTSPFKSVDDLGKLYRRRKAFPEPTGMHHWKSDVEFGKQRLTGCNPGIIQLCTKIPEKFDVTDEMLQPLLEEMTIKEAIKMKRLFIVDLEVTKDVGCTYQDKEICSPIALFFVDKESTLRPVAIQLFQDKAEDNPVFLPTDDEYTWMFAKMWFNNADASYHQSVAHLGMTHLLVESIAAATHSCLSPSHPLFRLLAPHFLYLMAINKLAWELLISEGGWVDKTMTIGRPGLFELLRRRFKTWRLDTDGNFPKDLESRGVLDPAVLPQYYFRDDALLLWDAIYDYVTTVVNGHYDTEIKISGDFELQEWHNALSLPVNEGGCGIKGVPGKGSFKTTAEIILTVASTIFTSSVLHATVNFGQYDNYGFPPHYPASINGKPPTNKEPKTEEDVLKSLPDKMKTLSIMEITKLLSTQATDELGNFEVNYQFDPVGEKAVKQFRKDLVVVASTIDQRNNDRDSVYTCLEPKHVPNAISI
ncbi:arachidonate 5-lipoxygenase-like [Anneissia japonica]|uniref:arachidonate 5-lipoxygenase-like n=1 Tax=Anneissia japonica TaxID=1529436 RepID=UPI0014256D78|nr:arachidonate 5-lipoxygenase-like [Anneissia japonica]